MREVLSIALDQTYTPNVTVTMNPTENSDSTQFVYNLFKQRIFVQNGKKIKKATSHFMEVNQVLAERYQECFEVTSKERNETCS